VVSPQKGGTGRIGASVDRGAIKTVKAWYRSFGRKLTSGEKMTAVQAVS